LASWLHRHRFPSAHARPLTAYLEAPNTKVWPLRVAAGVLVSIFHGRELNAEEYLHRITGYLHVHCG
jgi:hypothetical protein